MHKASEAADTCQQHDMHVSADILHKPATACIVLLCPWAVPEAAKWDEPFKLPLKTKAAPTCKPPSWQHSRNAESEVAQEAFV